MSGNNRDHWHPSLGYLVEKLWPAAVAQDDNKTPEAHLAMKKRMGERDGTNANRTKITSLQVAAGQRPAAQAHDAHGAKTPEQIAAMRQRTQAGVKNLNEVSELWPAASASVAQEGEGPETWLPRRENLKVQGINGTGAGMPLTMASVLFPSLWTTATTQDAENNAPPSTLERRTPPLNLQAAAGPPLWMAPHTMQGGGKNRSGERSGELLLPGQAEAFPPPLWANPCVPNGGRLGKRTEKGREGKTRHLEEQSASFPSSPQDRPTSKPGALYSPEHRGLLLRYRRWLYGRLGCRWTEKETDEETLKANPVRLSPYFTAWLMGWNIDFLLSDCSEMESCLSSVPWPCALSLLLFRAPQSQPSLFEGL